jgi:nucleoside-diphosphate-sugar epimerase
MRVFVTGSTGQVGLYLVKELVAAGHHVTGLVRSQGNADKLKQWGATPLMGDINDIDSLVAGVKDADATVHLAFNHDFTQYEQAMDTDHEAVKAMLAVSQGKVFVGTSGYLGVMKGDKIATEEDDSETSGFGCKRGLTEQTTRQTASSGVKCAVIRLPPSVHFVEDVGMVPSLVQIARRTNVSAYPNDGRTHWPAVHRDDAARLYKIVVEKLADGSLQSGLSLHGVGESAIASKDIATAIGEKLNLGEPVSKSPEHFGLLGMLFGQDLMVSNDLTRKWTGWQPTGPSLFDTIREPGFAPETLKTVL